MLELSSNTIKVLGIFGRLASEQETYFDNLEKKYSKKPDLNLGFDVFRHLTLSFVPGATVRDIKIHLDLLRDIKKFLPLKLKVNKLFVKDEESLAGAEHVAIEFGLDQTKEVVDFIRDRIGDKSVATWYIKVVWFVPKENQQQVMDELSELKEIEFTDFHLVSNKQSDENVIYSSSHFK